MQRTSSNDLYAYTGTYDVNRSYAANGLNQYTASGGVTPTYDGRGNMTSGGGSTYQYNSRNQLFSNGANDLFYRNPLGQLNHIINRGSGKVTNLDYVGGQLAGEYGGNGIEHRYIFDPTGGDTPLVQYEGSGTNARIWLHADERGSIVALSDGAGNPIAINSYDEYGIPGFGNVGRFQYTGQMWIPELGMYDYKARNYSPHYGRFLQSDPIGYGDGMNMYNYVGGDPVNGIDPLGLEYNCITYPGSSYYDPKDNIATNIATVTRCTSTPDVPLTNERGGGSVAAATASTSKPQSVTSKALTLGKGILCSDTTGDIADAVAGTITGGAASSGISTLNARYAAGVGGEIGSIVGRRAILIAAGPQALIAVGVALGTSYAVKYARGKVCPMSAGK